jgi:hypothetical protein
MHQPELNLDARAVSQEKESSSAMDMIKFNLKMNVDGHIHTNGMGTPDELAPIIYDTRATYGGIGSWQ